MSVREEPLATENIGRCNIGFADTKTTKTNTMTKTKTMTKSVRSLQQQKILVVAPTKIANAKTTKTNTMKKTKTKTMTKYESVRSL